MLAKEELGRSLPSGSILIEGRARRSIVEVGRNGLTARLMSADDALSSKAQTIVAPDEVKTVKCCWQNFRELVDSQMSDE